MAVIGITATVALGVAITALLLAISWVSEIKEMQKQIEELKKQ